MTTKLFSKIINSSHEIDGRKYFENYFFCKNKMKIVFSKEMIDFSFFKKSMKLNVIFVAVKEYQWA